MLKVTFDIPTIQKLYPELNRCFGFTYDDISNELTQVYTKKVFHLTPEEKELLQAKHRLEEIEARNRKKERNARTRRLIQEGAILESIAPHIKEMDLDTLKRELMLRLRGM